MIFNLLCVHESATLNTSARMSIRAHAVLHETDLKIEFEVISPHPLQLDPDGSHSEPVWQLWENDVVEAFVSVGEKTYFEFQVSPLGQYFELKVVRPREDVDRSFRSGLKWKAEIDPAGTNWKAEMVIPLKNLGWDEKPESVRGGLFAILGANEHKTYWAAFLPKQKIPDFHLPDYFRPLI